MRFGNVGRAFLLGTSALVMTSAQAVSADFDITVDTEAGSSSCTATQALSQSGVEPSASEACTSQVLDAGDSESCVFTNTVFFEGIPTLSQYGLAIMALLMPGVSMVGFRRFV